MGRARDRGLLRQAGLRRQRVIASGVRGFACSLCGAPKIVTPAPPSSHGISEEIAGSAGLSADFWRQPLALLCTAPYIVEVRRLCRLCPSWAFPPYELAGPSGPAFFLPARALRAAHMRSLHGKSSLLRSSPRRRGPRCFVFPRLDLARSCGLWRRNEKAWVPAFAGMSGIKRSRARWGRAWARRLGPRWPGSGRCGQARRGRTPRRAGRSGPRDRG